MIELATRYSTVSHMIKRTEVHVRKIKKLEMRKHLHKTDNDGFIFSPFYTSKFNRVDKNSTFGKRG